MKYTITLLTFFVTMTTLDARGFRVSRILSQDKKKEDASHHEEVIVNDTPQGLKSRKTSKTADLESEETSAKTKTIQPQEIKTKDASNKTVENKKIELDTESHRDELSTPSHDNEEIDVETKSQKSVQKSEESSQASNSDVIEETVIESKSKVLNKEGKSNSREGARLASLISVITLFALVK